MIARRLAFILRCVLSAGLIALVLRKVSWSELFEIVHRIDPKWALLASGLTGLLIIGLATRWQIFLRAKGIELSPRTIFALTWAGQFFNVVLPGSTGGDVAKIYQVCRLVPGDKAAAAATVLADRITGLLGLLFLAGFGLILNPLPFRIFSQESVVAGQTMWWLALAVVFALVSGWVLLRATRATIWGGRVRRTFAAVRRSFTFDRLWMTAFSIALAMHFVTILIAYLLAKALGVSLSYVQTLLIVPPVSLFIMLPITINGHGLRELLLIAYFSNLGTKVTGVPGATVREAVVAFSLLMVTNDLLWALPGGILYFLRFKPQARTTPST